MAQQTGFADEGEVSLNDKTDLVTAVDAYEDTLKQWTDGPMQISQALGQAKKRVAELVEIHAIPAGKYRVGDYCFEVSIERKFQVGLFPEDQPGGSNA